MKNIRNYIAGLAIFSMAGGLAMVPNTAYAAQHHESHRQQTKNSWRNLAYIAGAVGLYGIFKGDSTLAFVGAAGTLYSLSRYEHDRKSQSHAARERAAIFQRGYFYRDHHKYVRRTVTKNGHKYYQFVRA